MTLEQRVSRLENGMRRWRRAALVLGALLAGVVFMGADAGQPEPPKLPDEISAKRFILVDDAGKERAYLGLHKEHPRLQLNGSRGAVLLADAGADRAEVTVMRNKGRQMATVAVKSGASSVTVISKRDGRSKNDGRAEIRASKTGVVEFRAVAGGRSSVRGVAHKDDAYLQVQRDGKHTKLNTP